MKKDNLANQLPSNILELKPKDVNVNVDGDIVSMDQLEKIFFLTKLNNDPAFISSILDIDVVKIDRIINSCEFQKTINSYLSEYALNNAGETQEKLFLRYQEFFYELFTVLRISIGLKIRKSIEDDKPISGKDLNIPLIEKLAKLEFALKGLPLDLKGYLYAGKKDAADKTDDELLESIQGIEKTIKNLENKSFNPLDFESNDIEDIKEIKKEEVKEDEVKEVKEDEVKDENKELNI